MRNYSRLAFRSRSSLMLARRYCADRRGGPSAVRRDRVLARPGRQWTGQASCSRPARQLLVVGDTRVGDIIQVRKYSATACSSGRDLRSSGAGGSYWIATISRQRVDRRRPASPDLKTRASGSSSEYDPQGRPGLVDAPSGGMAVPARDRCGGQRLCDRQRLVRGYARGTTTWSSSYAPEGDASGPGFSKTAAQHFPPGQVSQCFPDETRLVVVWGGFSATWHALRSRCSDSASGQRLWNHVDTEQVWRTGRRLLTDGASVYVGKYRDWVDERHGASQLSTSRAPASSAGSYQQGIALSPSP